VLVEQAGQAALPGPLLSTLSASYVLAHCETDHAVAAMRHIANGEAATLASCNQLGSWDPNDTTVSFDGNRLNGTAWFVQDLQKAEHLLVTARQGSDTVLIWLPLDTPGIRTHADNIIDLTRDQGRVTFDNVEIAEHQLVAGPDNARTAIANSMPSLLVLVSADICGAAEWQLQTTSEYARTRKQFDHNIGFFQAVKHPLVEFMVALDLARSHLYNAACAIDHEPDNALVYARMAKASANEAAAFGSRKSVQLHGGIGFTWECFVHIYLKRQLHNQMLLGDAAFQRTMLAEALVGEARA
jgi:alkylation response protein AidB-like acyl-CoA dehydrogenase